MVKSTTQLSTNEIVLQLRLWAERIYKSKKHNAVLLINAADRLEELDERVAIMTEPSIPTHDELDFPPKDTELKGG